jgi:hypothetical protein
MEQLIDIPMVTTIVKQRATSVITRMQERPNYALVKWKRAWDEDMAIQYPPRSTSYRRFGFCRDAVHFYYLAKWLLKNNWDAATVTAPDNRLSLVFNLLRGLKNWVAPNSAKRGEELGSVNDIELDYAIAGLTLDMAQLFRAI